MDLFFAVVVCRTCDHKGAGSNLIRGCCVLTATHHTTPPGLINEYHRKLRSKRTSRDALDLYPWSCSFGWYPGLMALMNFCWIIMNIAINYISVVGLRVIKCTHINCVKFVCFFWKCVRRSQILQCQLYAIEL